MVKTFLTIGAILLLHSCYDRNQKNDLPEDRYFIEDLEQ